MKSAAGLGLQYALGIAATSALVLAFVGLGRLAGIARRDLKPMPAFDLIAGWALASVILIAAALLHIPLAPVGWFCVILGVLAFAALRGPGVEALVVGTILTTPLIVLAVASPAVMYDEFGHWLPNARFAFETGMLPSALHPDIASDMPDYPYAGPFINFLASVVASRWIDVAAKIFTVVLFGQFGILLARTVTGEIRGAPRYLSYAFGIAFVTILDPGFDPRTALTSYTDAPSAVLTALAMLSGWYGCRAFDDGDRSAARVWFWRGGFVLLAMILTRDTNLILAVAVALGLCVAERRQLLRHSVPLLRATVPAVALPLAGFLLWRLYSFSAHLPPSLGVLPLSRWEWLGPLRVLHALFSDRLPAHPILGGGALCLVVALIAIAWTIVRHFSPADRSLVVAIVIASAIWLVFLAWAYIATMTPNDTANAISAWRYTIQLVPMLLLTLVPLLSRCWRWLVADNRLGGVKMPTLSALAMLAVFVEPVALPAPWRNDCTMANIVAAQLVAQVFASDLRQADGVTIIDASDGPWSALAITYALGLPRDRVKGLTVPATVPLSAIAGDLPAKPQSLLLDLRPLDRDAIRQGRQIPAINIYRRRPDDGHIVLLSRSAPTTLAPVCDFPRDIFTGRGDRLDDRPRA